MLWQDIKNIYHGLAAGLAAMYYGFPGKKLRVIGITGTDGKTTTTHLIHHILKTAGKKASLVSTVYAEIAGKTYDTGFHVTTPDPFMLQNFLRQAVNKGEEFLVLEVTSHGLDQNRVWGIDFEIGVVTNVTHEHLDYHKNYKNYVLTKEKLLIRATTAIINQDDESYKYFAVSKYNRVITYGIKKKSDVTPENFSFKTKLPGKYNQYNCLAAIAVCKKLGISDMEIRKGILTFSGVVGRFEKIPNKKDLTIIIDFAHTPNAIENVLSYIKPQVKGKLIHVFGAAALRDHSKRPLMGENSAKYSDYIVLTEEDYRSEDVNEIIEQIAVGCKRQRAIERNSNQIELVKQDEKEKRPVFFRIPDRQEAINFAVRKLAKKGDTVILTGKAHEKSLCRGKIEYPWDEYEAVKKALQ